MDNDTTPKTAPPGSPALAGYVAGLRACPLCGGRPKITGASILGGLLNNLGIECQTCGMETRSGQFESNEDLVDFWNGAKPHTSEVSQDAGRKGENAK